MLKRVLLGCAMGAALSASAWAACDPQRNPIPASRYATSGAEVTDKETGLVWQRCSVGQTWQEG